MATSEKTEKYRYFAGFVYKHDKDGNVQIEEEELLGLLRISFGDFAVSPLHEPDEEQEDEHWHVVYHHPNSVRWEVARKFMLSVGVPFFNDYIIALHHPSNYQRYLVHLDNPEKQQFAGGAELIQVVNNFPLNVMRDLSTPQKLEIQMEIESFAVEFNILEYASMALYLSSHGMQEHYLYFTTHTHHFGKFLDSLRYSAEQRSEVDLDA